MEKVFIEARYINTIDLKSISDEELRILPKKIAVFTTVQYMNSLKTICSYFKSKGFEIILIKPKHCEYEGQVLGCSIQRIDSADGFVYIGDGRFHPTALAIKNNKPVFILDPEAKQIQTVSEEWKSSMKKRIKAGLVKFHSSKKIGILISTKPGQHNDAVYKLEEKFPDKRFYPLVADTFDPSSLENFNFIECFVNTACPRISFDDSESWPKPLIDISELI